MLGGSLFFGTQCSCRVVICDVLCIFHTSATGTECGVRSEPGAVDEVVRGLPMSHQVRRLFVGDTHVAVVEHAREEVVNLRSHVHDAPHPADRQTHTHSNNNE